MRRVRGATDHVVVVGAGLGGLSAALRLAGAGRRVTVLERTERPGGRAGTLEAGGYRFDTGPTVLTMPELVADALACVGEDVADWLDLVPLDPVYRAFFADGSSLDVHPDLEAMTDEVALVCGTRAADGYRRFVDFTAGLYRIERDAFIDRNLDSPLDLLTPALARLVAAGGFRRLGAKVRSLLPDPRLQRVFSFQAMYAGLSPADALALYAVISYLDSVGGVWYPRGGVHAVPVALAGAARRHGVELRYGTAVSEVELTGTRAVAVRTSDGERVACDAVVLNADLPASMRLLGRPVPPLRYSPSCVVLHVGSRASYARTAHHCVHFGTAWERTFEEVIGEGRVMSDPSFLVTNPSRSDATVAPPGGQTYYVLFPAPNLSGPIDWSAYGPRYRDEIVRTLEQRGYVGFGDGIEVEAMTTPADWAAQGLERGTPFSAAHTLRQTGPFRPANLWGENVVLAGCGTVPGVGVPMVLISGRLAAERIVGPTR